MIQDYNPVIQTVLGTGLTWGVTALGAAFCILHTASAQSQRWLLDGSLGFSAGVMLAASYWSLLEPAISMAKGEFNMGVYSVIPALVGLILGTLFVILADQFLPQQWFEEAKTNSKSPKSASVNLDGAPVHISDRSSNQENVVRLRKTPISTSAGDLELSLNSCVVTDTANSAKPQVMTRRLWLLLIAVTVHNIPEGLAVGIGFGGLQYHSGFSFYHARNLAIGIAIQNFPEGLAVSLPLRASGYGFWKSFWYGQLSGFVEPIAGLLGCLCVQFFTMLQPYALGFAAGAMIFVVFDDVLPEAQTRGNGRLASICGVIGFIVMMVLDVVTGGD
ncbi:unnamed protein product [Calicophoron daubneyi]|uniref:Zinc transporter ZIP11 n=1 Tax=Calicophoron daubneyi TaxID=300641 RepID=A0AAV2TVX4_CALDB